LKCDGFYYLIYNRWDSGIYFMGVNIARQIIALAHRFHGVADAKEHWRFFFSVIIPSGIC
jgi:hypothetical protein